jgi:hypothetical protein
LLEPIFCRGPDAPAAFLSSNRAADNRFTPAAKALMVRKTTAIGLAAT